MAKVSLWRIGKVNLSHLSPLPSFDTVDWKDTCQMDLLLAEARGGGHQDDGYYLLPLHHGIVVRESAAAIVLLLDDQHCFPL